MMPDKPILSEERKALERLIYRLLFAALASLAVLLFAPFVWNMMSPFIICIPIAAMFQPVVGFLVKKLKMKRSPSSALLVILVLLMMIGAIAWFCIFGFGKLNSFIASAPTLLAGAVSGIRNGFENIMASMSSMSPDVVTWMRSLMNEALSWITVQGTTLGGKLVGLLTGMAAGIPNAFIYLNFLMMAMFFITRDYPKIRAKLPGGRAYDPNSNASQLTQAGIIGALAYLRMQGIYGIISLVVGWIWLSLFGIPYSWAIALCAGFLEFLPLFGNGTLYIPWSIIAYVLGDVRTGTLVIGLYLLLITFRRVTEPKIMSDSTGVSPLASLIGMFIGLQMGGIIGLIGGPIVMTILSYVVKGTYLNGIRQDCHTLISYCRHRWDWADPAPYTPPEEGKDSENPGENAKAGQPARFRKSLSRKGKKK